MGKTTIVHYSDSFTIVRGPGQRLSESYWGDNPVTKALPDDGAKINFNTYKTSDKSALLNIDFSYSGPSNREFSRSIDMSLENTVQLIKFLNNIVYQIALESEYFYYLAYGPDILSERILVQAPSAIKIQSIILSGYKLEFNKRSLDGSVTANIKESYYDWVDYAKPSSIYCVLYKIKKVHKANLEVGERMGNGYLEKEILLTLDNGEKVSAITYLADQAYIVNDSTPSQEYIDLIIKGAIENEFPNEYIMWLKDIRTTASQID